MSANPCELELWIHFSFSSSVKFYAIKSFFLDLNIFCTNNTLKMQQSRVFVTWKFPCDQQIYFVGWRKSADKKFHISYLRLRGDNQYWMSTFSGLTLRWTKPLQNILLLKNISWLSRHCTWYLSIALVAKPSLFETKTIMMVMIADGGWRWCNN